jgi:cobalt/nickel transport system ATP-binding protein
MKLEPIIEVSHLSFKYPDGRAALSDINLQVFAGERVALVGANGAGKSTLLMHLNGIFTGMGKIRIDGLEVNKSNLGRIRALAGVVFQNPDDQLFSPTVFEDVAYGPVYQGLDKLSVKARVDEALAEVHMTEYADRNPYHLSGGEKKRIAIATVLSMQPKILLFDEPTSGLDPRARRELIELLETLPQTMVIATHDLEMARQLTTRMVILKHGQIVLDASTRQLLEQPDLLFANDLA